MTSVSSPLPPPPLSSNSQWFLASPRKETLLDNDHRATDGNPKKARSSMENSGGLDAISSLMRNPSEQDCSGKSGHFELEGFELDPGAASLLPPASALALNCLILKNQEHQQAGTPVTSPRQLEENPELAFEEEKEELLHYTESNRRQRTGHSATSSPSLFFSSSLSPGQPVSSVTSPRGVISPFSNVIAVRTQSSPVATTVPASLPETSSPSSQTTPVLVSSATAVPMTLGTSPSKISSPTRLTVASPLTVSSPLAGGAEESDRREKDRIIRSGLPRKYRLRDKVGTGGYSSVWSAEVETKDLPSSPSTPFSNTITVSPSVGFRCPPIPLSASSSGIFLNNLALSSSSESIPHPSPSSTPTNSTPNIELHEALDTPEKTQLVAVKYVPKVRLRETQKERIRSEIRLLDSVIKLNSGPHPHILRLIEAYETSTAFFIVTELLDIDLFEVAAEHPFTEEETRHIVVSLCRALEFLHWNRIVHRDLKLENVYLSSRDDLLSSVVKLGDFGLARQLRSKSVKEEGENELYSPCGTPTYLAPEVAKSEGYSMSADLWSLGVLTYILLYGYPPFASDDVDELLQQIVVADYSLPSEGCSEEASDLVRGLLERDPQKRLTSQQVLSHPWITGSRLEREDGFHNDSRPRLSLNLRKRTSSFSSRKPSTRSAAPRATSFSSPLLTSTLLKSQSSSRSDTEMSTLKESGSGSERSDIRRLGAGVASPSINNYTR